MGLIPLNVSGKVALVTGANSGIGYETSLALAKGGATVILACRDAKAQDTAALIKSAIPGAKVEAGPPLDLELQDSVRKFAEAVIKTYPKIHILVNNAGVSHSKKEMVDGVGVYTQINYLGPYTMTRLLEKRLIASRARIVTVSSVMHRMVRIKDVDAFFHEFKAFYEHSKLANVLFAFELQRRLSPLGVTSVAADPGAVSSAIWDKSPGFQKGVVRNVLDFCYSPPRDGAVCVIHCASVPWQKDEKDKNGIPTAPPRDLRYYARGLFASSVVCNMSPLPGGIAYWFWALSALCCSLVDWPLRRYTGGWLCSWVGPVKASWPAYNEDLAKKLWDKSADLAKLPREVSL